MLVFAQPTIRDYNCHYFAVHSVLFHHKFCDFTTYDFFHYGAEGSAAVERYTVTHNTVKLVKQNTVTSTGQAELSNMFSHCHFVIYHPCIKI